MKTILYPRELKGNAYISIIKKAIESSGHDIYDLPDIKHNISLARQIEIINLNWFDSIGNCGRLKAWALLIRQMGRIYYYKFCGMKIIYTMHNKQAHDTKYAGINRYLMQFLCKKADRIAVLCSHSEIVLKQFLSEKEIKQKMRVMYHPSYSDTIDTNILKIPELPEESGELRILYLGMIRPYKNIELILEAAKSFKGKKIKFVVAGKAQDEEYKKKIEFLCKGLENVRLISRFVDDKELASFYNWADIILNPLSQRSSLNSGSCIMAFSMGRTVIAPRIGTLMDYPEEKIFTYNYESEADHIIEIVKSIEKVYAIWLQDSGALIKLGNELKAFTDENFSQRKTNERYQKLYLELENIKRRH